MYTYVILVRPSMEGASAEVMDVSHLANTNIADMVAANRVCERMGSEKPYDTVKAEQESQYIHMLWLRARYNNAEGPFLIKAEEPIEGGDVWDTLVRDKEFMNKLRKEGRL